MSPDNLDKWVEEIQKEIIDEEVRRYNKYIVSLMQNPKNWGKPNSSEISVWHAYEGPCGDTMYFFLKIEKGVIEKANFMTDGCGATVAAGCQTTILIQGKTLEYAKTLTPADIDNSLGGLPDDHKHCAELAIRTLIHAIEKYRKKISHSF
ncbi:MAG: iron-sulfur cluster assembly scaffold protein [Candidatus Hermodarchaeota archaeon]